MSTIEQRSKIRKVLGEFKDKELRSSAGQRVKSKKQALAIALSEAGLARKRKKKRRSA